MHAEAARACFREKSGLEAAHLIYAPGRVNLIGDHTDYNGGFVLPMAIELGVYLAARPRTDRRVRIWSAQMEGEPAEFDAGKPVGRGDPAWSNYLRGVVAGFQDVGAEWPGCDIAVSASLPAGGGLSSSAALEVAGATLGEVLTGRVLDPVEKALLCQKAENVFAGMPCGIMDQFAVTFGKSGHLLLLDCQSLEHQLVPMHGSDTEILVINTMVRHELTDGGYASRRADCDAAARLLGVKLLREVTPEQVEEATAVLPERLLRRARHVTTENARTLAAVDAFRRGDWTEVGRLMGASHESLRDDFEVSCAELDLVVAAARELGEARGIHGCRMTGGGFGGCCVALVRTAQAAEAAQALAEAYRAASGIEPVLFITRPADGPQALSAS
jgi:galactokinase